MRLTSKEATVRSIVLLALAACATAAAPSPQACPPSTPPITSPAGQISVEGTTHDLGEVLRGETVSHMFRLTNTSSSDVTLFEVRACCTCATAAMTIGEKHMTAEETVACKLLGTLKPKEHAELTVTLDTLDDGCGSKDGSISKSVRVYSSDRATSPQTISIAGKLVTPYTLEPAILKFGTVKQGQAATVSCDLTAAKLGDLKVTHVRPSCDFVKATIEQIPTSPTSSSAFRVTAELLPTAPLANYHGRIVLELDHARVRAIVVPLSVAIETPSARTRTKN
jgi:hypothetical protein